ncbi:MAG TPA: hypothetical protein VN200_07840 [Rhodoglobus sp.]|nr:hypothetical protein [Rhodoglobus sp.]
MSPAEAAALLGVPVQAAPEEVARAFRSRARAVHPDTTGGPGDEFVRLAQARDALLAHRPPPVVRAVAVPRFSRRLFATWIGLLAVACLLGASGEWQPLTPVEPIVRSAALLAGFAGYALTGRRGWAILGLAALVVTVFVAVVFTTLGSLAGLLLAIPALYGLSLMGVRRRIQRGSSTTTGV